MRLAAGLRPDLLGGAIALPRPLAVKRGGEGGEGKERIGDTEGEEGEGRGGKDVKG